MFIHDPKGEQRSENKLSEKRFRERNRQRGRVNGEQGIAKRHKGYRSPSVGESRGKGRSAVADAKPKSPCRHCNGTGDSAVTDTYGSIGPVRLSWQKGDEVYSAVVPMRLVPSPPPFPPPSHLKPGRKAAEKVTKSFITTHGKTIRRGKTIGGGEDDKWPTFQPEGHNLSLIHI